jgi:hypothetical protein
MVALIMGEGVVNRNAVHAVSVFVCALAFLAGWLTGLVVFFPVSAIAGLIAWQCFEAGEREKERGLR